MATIIKHDTAQLVPAGTSVQGVAFDFQDMHEHGDAYLHQVRQEAAKIVQQANAEADQIKQRAEAAGREAAEQAIEQLLDQKVAAQVRTLRPALDNLVRELDDTRGAWLDHWEQASLKLATEIAGRMVRHEVEVKPEVTLDWVREALSLASGASEVTVLLNTTDYQNLGQQVEQIVDSLNLIAKPRITASDAITLGGCRIETQHGSIDYQIETQLQRMIEELS